MNRDLGFVIRESGDAKNKKPIPFENRLKFHPKIFVEYPTPRRVGYSLPKIRKNSQCYQWSATPLSRNLSIVRCKALGVKLELLLRSAVSNLAILFLSHDERSHYFIL